MGLETMGLGGVLSFDAAQGIGSIGQTDAAFGKLNATSDRTASQMGLVSQSFGSMQSQASLLSAGIGKISSGLGQVSSAMKSATLVTSGVSLAVGVGVKQAADFESQMSAVRSILAPTVGSAQQLDSIMGELTSRAKLMGVQTKFSATQAGEAIESLARAGLSGTEIVDALQGTLYAAAAEGMNLADAASIVASNVRAFGLDAVMATHVADVLAVASANANTNIVGLGEGLKYAAPFAKQLGVPVEDTVAALGMLADVGIDASSAGTALKNAFQKLISPTDQGREIMKQMGLQIKDTSGNFVGLESLLRQLDKGMKQFKGNTERTAAASELLGLRGMPLISLLDRIDKSTAKGARTFGEFSEILKTTKDAAKEMAETRLNNLSGALTILSSNVEGASLALFSSLLPSLTTVVRTGSSGLGQLSQAIEKVAESPLYKFLDSSALASEGFSDSVAAIAIGIARGKDTIVDAIDTITGMAERGGGAIADFLGADRLASLAEFATVLVAVAAASAPVLATLATVGFVLTAIVIPAATGLATVAGGIISVLAGIASGPLLPFLGIAAVAFAAFRSEGESFGDTMVRAWDMLSTAAIDAWNKGVLPFVDGLLFVLGPAIDDIGSIAYSAFNLLVGTARQAASFITDLFSGVSMSWMDMFSAGESVGLALSNVWFGLKTAVLDVWNTAVMPFWQGVQDAWMAVEEDVYGLQAVWGEVFSTIGSTAMEVFGIFRSVLGDTETDWRSVGQTAVQILGTILTTVSDVVLFSVKAMSYIVPIAVKVGMAVHDFVVAPFEVVLGTLGNVWEAVQKMYSGDVLSGFKRLGLAVADSILTPLRSMVASAITLAEALKFDIPQALRTFAYAGITGLVYPEEEKGAVVPPLPVPKPPPAAAGEAARSVLSSEKLSSDIAAKTAEALKQNPPKLDVKQSISIDNKLSMDGRELDIARGRSKKSLLERTGAQTNWWQSRLILERGSTPSGG